MITPYKEREPQFLTGRERLAAMINRDQILSIRHFIKNLPNARRDLDTGKLTRLSLLDDYSVAANMFRPGQHTNVRWAKTGI